MEKTIDSITYSTNKDLLDIRLIHAYLCNESYWAKGITIERVENFIEHSLCLGAYSEHGQVAFGRLITDYTSFGYLADVFVLGDFRKRGISKHLTESVIDMARELKLKRILLSTSDAHGLYSKFGFTELQNPEKMMELNLKDEGLKTDHVPKNS